MSFTYSHDALLVPPGAKRVATYDANGRLLQMAGTNPAPQSIVQKPNNASVPVTVSLTAYTTGTRIFIEPTSSPAAQNVTITPKGSFVGPTGTAIQQCVIDQVGGFAVCDIIGGVTVLSLYKGCDLTT